MSAAADASGVFWGDVEIVADRPAIEPKKRRPPTTVPAWAWVVSAVSVNAGVALLLASAALVIMGH